jgi:hypothetical protein
MVQFFFGDTLGCRDLEERVGGERRGGERRGGEEWGGGEVHLLLGYRLLVEECVSLLDQTQEGRLHLLNLLRLLHLKPGLSCNITNEDLWP